MDVDPGVLAEALRHFLAPVLPYLAGLGGSAAEEVAKESGKAAARKLGERIWPTVEAKEAAKEAAEDLAADPADPDAQAAFRVQLKKLLAADEDLAAEVTRELEQAGILVQRQSGSGGQAHGSLQAVAGERGVATHGGLHGAYVFTGDVEGGVVITPPAPPTEAPHAESPSTAETLRAAYLHHLFAHLRKLRLSGVDPELAQDAKKEMDLDAVYTALLTQSELSPEEGAEPEALARRGGRHHPASALEQLDRHRRLVLLGDPGSGKSTFVSFVALCMAGELLGREGANLALLTAPLPRDDEHRPWDPDEEEPELQPWHREALLPVHVVLRDFAAGGLPGKGTRGGAGHLLDFLGEGLESSGLGAFRSALEAELHDPGGLVLLDGLDEVPEAETKRVQLRDVVQDFAGAFPNCRIVVTSRIYAYQNQEWTLGEEFREATLAPFSRGQIRRFVARWYREVARRRPLLPDEAQGKAELLERAIFANDRLLALAERPLLLTLMASLHAWRGGTLPEKRESLYAAAVDLLLAHWERQRTVPGKGGELVVVQPSLAEWLKVSQDRLAGALDELAFHAHLGQETEEGTADVPEGDLLAALGRVSAEAKANPTLLVEFLRDRAGLLLPRGVGVYTFPHRTFQEYLAARHLTTEDFPQRVAELARHDPERWRETTLLAGAKAARGIAAGVWLLADELSPRDPREEGAEPADHWGALLAGQVLAESADLQRVSPAQAKKLETFRTHLLSVMHGTALPSVERALAGRVLAELGDPREEVTTLDGMELCYVPAGPFRMGSEEDEKPLHDLEIPYGYWLARYPVTVAQWRQYVEERDEEPEYRGNLEAPRNQPIIAVTWHEAQRFCEWLTERWRDRGLLPAGWAVRLPSEAEWEKAARGGSEVPVSPQVRRAYEGAPLGSPSGLDLAPNGWPERSFPWGEDFEEERANTGVAGVGRVSAAGCFGGGASPYGCEELSGNVWEWTRSLWDEDAVEPKFTYPYAPDDGREDPEAPDETRRVLRGGAFHFGATFARCSVRLRYHPDFRYYFIGIRVSVSPFSSDL